MREHINIYEYTKTIYERMIWRDISVYGRVKHIKHIKAAYRLKVGMQAYNNYPRGIKTRGRFFIFRKTRKEKTFRTNFSLKKSQTKKVKFERFSAPEKKFTNRKTKTPR